jgi:hypothetical protein
MVDGSEWAHQKNRLNFPEPDLYVNLEGKTYAFSVEAAGNALTLEESETLLPDRPALQPGTQAPSFSGTDIDQRRHRSEDWPINE